MQPFETGLVPNRGLSAVFKCIWLKCLRHYTPHTPIMQCALRWTLGSGVAACHAKIMDNMPVSPSSLHSTDTDTLSARDTVTPCTTDCICTGLTGTLNTELNAILPFIFSVCTPATFMRPDISLLDIDLKSQLAQNYQ